MKRAILYSVLATLMAFASIIMNDVLIAFLAGIITYRALDEWVHVA